MKVEFPKVNNKLAFFDFDRTLVAHEYPAVYTKDSLNDYFMECLYTLTSLKDIHVHDRPLPCMQWYTKKLYDEGYGLYCLTHEMFNLRDALKQEQLKLYYPDTPMTYLTVNTPEHKIDMIRAVAAAECCELSDIIFVDDLTPTVNLAEAAGIDAKHLSDIVVMYERREVHQEQTMVVKPGSIGSGLSAEGLKQIYQECSSIVEGGIPL